MSWVGLWSSSGFALIIWIVVSGHVLGVLWSSPGSVVISWIVGCGHVLDGSVVISWVCGHLLSLWSFPGSWFLVMPWVCGHFLARGLWSCLGSCLGWVCDHLLGL